MKMRSTHRFTAILWMAAALLCIGVHLPSAQAQDSEENLNKRIQELENKQEDLLDQLENSNKSQGGGDDYGLNVHTSDGSGKLRFETDDGDFKMEIGGRIMWDITLTDVDDNVESAIESDPSVADTSALDSGVEFRRARLYTEGTLYGTVGYKLQLDFAGGTELKSVYLDFPSPIKNSGIKVGRFKEPFSLDELTSSRYIEFMQRSTLTNFAPSRTAGIMLSGDAGEGMVNYGIGTFRSTTDNFGFSQGEGENAITGRVAALPWSNEDNSQLVHAGLGVSQRSLSGFSYGTRPEVHLVDDFVAASVGDAEAVTLLGLEAAWVWNSLSVQGEWLQADVDSQAAGDPSYDAYYLQASYWLTGEHRVYDGGEFDRVKPKKNFLGDDNGSGAWQVAVRFSSVDLTETSDGELDDITLGINWHWNPATRIMLNYVNADVTNGVGGADGGADFITMRFQIDF